jgi:hypothetical protein
MPKRSEPNDILTELADIQRRLANLERAPQAPVGPTARQSIWASSQWYVAPSGAGSFEALTFDGQAIEVTITKPSVYNRELIVAFGANVSMNLSAGSTTNWDSAYVTIGMSGANVAAPGDIEPLAEKSVSTVSNPGVGTGGYALRTNTPVGVQYVLPDLLPGETTFTLYFQHTHATADTRFGAPWLVVSPPH